jgi:hypothetical protein
MKGWESRLEVVRGSGLIPQLHVSFEAHGLRSLGRHWQEACMLHASGWGLCMLNETGGRQDKLRWVGEALQSAVQYSKEKQQKDELHGRWLDDTGRGVVKDQAGNAWRQAVDRLRGGIVQC